MIYILFRVKEPKVIYKIEENLTDCDAYVWKNGWIRTGVIPRELLDELLNEDGVIAYNAKLYTA